MNGILKQAVAYTGIVTATAFPHTLIWAGDMRGNLSAQVSYFSADTDRPNSWQLGGSIAADIELYKQIADNVSLTIRPFFRIDQHDEERSHADFREFILTTNGDNWEFSGGLGQVFWGVTESRNPVDVINQIDNLENIDGSSKLGQLMLSFKWFADAGDFEIFALPHFRTRKFAGKDGRPFPGFILTDPPQYESDDGNRHIDLALRWSRSFDSWDLGLHYFNGTSRDPAIVPLSPTALSARYQQMEQYGLDALGIFGDLNTKLELIHRSGIEFENHAQAVTGIEYTFVGLLSPLQDNEILPPEWCNSDSRNPVTKLLCNDRMDMGVVLEYLWDQRGEDTTQPFQNDLLAGLRFAFNDERSSDALIGIVRDLDHSSTTLSLEASTRLFESFRLSTDVRLFSNVDDDPQLQSLADEDFVRVDLAYFF